LSGRTKPTICRICKENCGILVKSKGSKGKITGNRAHPAAKGFICFRGKRFVEAHTSREGSAGLCLERARAGEKSPLYSLLRTQFKSGKVC
jgi:hypothetical protein